MEPDEVESKDPVLAHLEGISAQLDRVEEKLDSNLKRAVIAGGISGAIAGSLVPPIVQAGIELAKAKLGM